MRFRPILILLLLLLSGVVMFLSSCIRDDSDMCTDIGPENSSHQYQFSFEVPHVTTVTTRAASESYENSIKSLKLLVCDTISTDNQDGNLVSIVDCKDIMPKQGATDNTEWTFTATLDQGTYDLILIANSDIVISELTPGTSREALYQALQVVHQDKWVVDGSSEDTSIPMWGELGCQTLGRSYTTGVFNLNRMLARINVSLDESISNFHLTSISYYNYTTKGSLVPNSDNYTKDASTGKITASSPTIPDNSCLFGSFIEYRNAKPDDVRPINNGTSCLNEIYVFESMHQAPYGSTNSETSKTWIENPCLVIGGEYDDGNETFYRVDFIAGSSNWLSVLRNHHYNINITKVDGAGYKSRAQAYISAPINMEVDVTEWDDNQIGNIVVDGPYMLGVNKASFLIPSSVLNKDEESNKFIVSTNYVNHVPGEKNWEAVFSTSETEIIPFADDEVWVGFGTDKSQSVDSSGESDVNMIFSSPNPIKDSRTAYIHVSAGRMKIVVTVTQSAKTYLLEINDPVTKSLLSGQTITFYENIGVTEHARKDFSVNWWPADENVNVNILYRKKGDDPGEWEFDTANGSASASDLETIGNSGSKAFSVAPRPLNGAYQNEYYVTIVYSIGEGDDMVSASITLAQGVFDNMELTYNNYINYGQGPYSINVKSDFDWQIKSITESTGRGNIIDIAADRYLYDLLDKQTVVRRDPIKGTDLRFHVHSEDATPRGTTVIRFVDKNNPNRYKDISFDASSAIYRSSHGGWATSNIYWDGSKLTFTDYNSTTYQYNQGLYFKFGSLVGLSPVGSSWSTSSAIYAPTEWSGKSSVNTTGKEWSDIPYVETSPPLEFVLNRQHLMEVHDPAKGVGDICKYITDKGWAPGQNETPKAKWRMPTATEFGTASNYTAYGTASSITSTSATGQHKVNNFYLTRIADSGNTPSSILPTLPASGYRVGSIDNGNLSNTGNSGNYWSASPTSTTYGYSLVFNSSSIMPSTGAKRQYGYAVRCVREASTPVPVISAKIGTGTNVTVSGTNAKVSIQVTSNSTWTVSLSVDTGSIPNPSTMFSAMQGTGNGTITFTPGNNTEELVRVFTIYFTNGNTKTSVTVTQLRSVQNFSSHSGWAGSNIYWDGSKLTFADVGQSGQRFYQGLYFKSGSLVGMSPVGDWSTSTIVYAPTEWSGKSSFKTSGYTWEQIPTASAAAPPTSYATDNQYLLQIHRPAHGVGDICKYITDKGWAPGASSGAKWRMPTAIEVRSENYILYHNGVGSGSNLVAGPDYVSDDTWGRFEVSSRVKKFGYVSTGLLNSRPFSGLRSGMDGRVLNVGTNCCIRSASPQSATRYHTTLIHYYETEGTIDKNANTHRENGLVVRCVKY